MRCKSWSWSCLPSCDWGVVDMLKAGVLGQPQDSLRQEVVIVVWRLKHLGSVLSSLPWASVSSSIKGAKESGAQESLFVAAVSVFAAGLAHTLQLPLVSSVVLFCIVL